MPNITLELPARAARHDQRTALIDTEGELTYRELLAASQAAAGWLLDGESDLKEARVACLVPPGRHYVIAQWATWLAGGISVPLCLSHPLPEMEYVLEDSDAGILIVHPDFEEAGRRLAEAKSLRLIRTPDWAGADLPSELPEIPTDRRALVIYTSGTTGKPKGVVTTHTNIQSQVTSLVEAWGWTKDDRILHVLPLHHVHGVINVLCCALWSGAVCEMLPGFEAGTVWRRFQEGDLNLFMAVPSIYQRLTRHWEEATPDEKKRLSAACQKFRLMVCGSAALPVPVLEKWREISGHTLLERYGMTEIGMALSNPLHGERIPGAVGSPLPGVEVRLTDESGHRPEPGQPGEIEVRGGNVFLEYWRRPEETRNAFRDGWFRSGDIATCEDGIYRILGRNSVDIIKTGGYKVSALEIEQELLSHPSIAEVAVVGVEDVEWGERVCAAVVLRDGAQLTLEELRGWAKERLAVYKVPSRLLSVEQLPRNAMGKVTKKAVQPLFQEPPTQA